MYSTNINKTYELAVLHLLKNKTMEKEKRLPVQISRRTIHATRGKKKFY
jgi:hypothetical protein